MFSIILTTFCLPLTKAECWANYKNFRNVRRRKLKLSLISPSRDNQCWYFEVCPSKLLSVNASVHSYSPSCLPHVCFCENEIPLYMWGFFSLPFSLSFLMFIYYLRERIPSNTRLEFTNHEIKPEPKSRVRYLIAWATQVPHLFS